MFEDAASANACLGSPEEVGCVGVAYEAGGGWAVGGWVGRVFGGWWECTYARTTTKKYVRITQIKKICAEVRAHNTSMCVQDTAQRV